jgi:hypothetical protein
MCEITKSRNQQLHVNSLLVYYLVVLRLALSLCLEHVLFWLLLVTFEKNALPIHVTGHVIGHVTRDSVATTQGKRQSPCMLLSAASICLVYLPLYNKRSSGVGF